MDGEVPGDLAAVVPRVVSGHVVEDDGAVLQVSAILAAVPRQAFVELRAHGDVPEAVDLAMTRGL